MPLVWRFDPLDLSFLYMASEVVSGRYLGPRPSALKHVARLPPSSPLPDSKSMSAIQESLTKSHSVFREYSNSLRTSY